MFLITPIKNLSSLVDDGQTEGTARAVGSSVCVIEQRSGLIYQCVCVCVCLLVSLLHCTGAGDSLKDCAAVAFADSEYLSKA